MSAEEGRGGPWSVYIHKRLRASWEAACPVAGGTKYDKDLSSHYKGGVSLYGCHSKPSPVQYSIYSAVYGHISGFKEKRGSESLP